MDCAEAWCEIKAVKNNTDSNHFRLFFPVTISDFPSFITIPSLLRRVFGLPAVTMGLFNHLSRPNERKSSIRATPVRGREDGKAASHGLATLSE